MHYYQRLIELRENKTLRQKEITAILDTYREQYSRWERGAQEIPFHHVITLAKYYGCSIDYIAGLTNKKYRPQ